MPVSLPVPQLLEIAGPDAIGFAHAQFASDVRALGERRWQWSAWLSPQGRVRALFQLLRTGEDRLLVLLRGGSANALRAALTAFLLRSRARLVTVSMSGAGLFDADEAAHVLGAVPEPFDLAASDGSIGFALPGTPRRWCALSRAATGATDATPEALNRWRLADIEAGLVELAPTQLDRLLPDWLGLRRLGAISANKGCYPGQEIVARLHFRGGGRRRPFRVEFEAATLPAAETPLYGDADNPVGELLNAAWASPRHGLALAVLADTTAGTALRGPGGEPAFRVVSAIDSASD